MKDETACEVVNMAPITLATSKVLQAKKDAKEVTVVEEEDEIEEYESADDEEEEEIMPILPDGEAPVVKFARTPEQEAHPSKCPYCPFTSPKVHALPGHYVKCPGYRAQKERAAEEGREKKIKEYIIGTPDPKERSLAEEAREDEEALAGEIFASPARKLVKGEDQNKTKMLGDFGRLVDTDDVAIMAQARAKFIRDHQIEALGELVLKEVSKGAMSSKKARLLLARNNGQRRQWTTTPEFTEMQKTMSTEIYADSPGDLRKEEQEFRANGSKKATAGVMTPVKTLATSGEEEAAAVTEAEAHEKRKVAQITSTPGKTKVVSTTIPTVHVCIFSKVGEEQTLRMLYVRDKRTGKYTLPCGEAKKTESGGYASQDTTVHEMTKEHLGLDLSRFEVQRGEHWPDGGRIPGQDLAEFYLYLHEDDLKKLKLQAPHLDEALLVSRTEIADMGADKFVEGHTLRAGACLRKLLQGTGLKTQEFKIGESNLGKVALPPAAMPPPPLPQRKLLPVFPSFVGEKKTGEEGPTGGEAVAETRDIQTPLYAEFLRWKNDDPEAKARELSGKRHEAAAEERRVELLKQMQAAQDAKKQVEQAKVELAAAQRKEDEAILAQEEANKLAVRQADEQKEKQKAEELRREEELRRVNEEIAALEAAEATRQEEEKRRRNEEETKKKEEEETRTRKEAESRRRQEEERRKWEAEEERGRQEEAHKKRQEEAALKMQEEADALMKAHLAEFAKQAEEEKVAERLREEQLAAEVVVIPDSPTRTMDGVQTDPSEKVRVLILNEQDAVLASTPASATKNERVWHTTAEKEKQFLENTVACAKRAIFEQFGMRLPIGSLVKIGEDKDTKGNLILEYVTCVSSNLHKHVKLADGSHQAFFLPLKQVVKAEENKAVVVPDGVQKLSEKVNLAISKWKASGTPPNKMLLLPDDEAGLLPRRLGFEEMKSPTTDNVALVVENKWKEVEGRWEKRIEELIKKNQNPGVAAPPSEDLATKIDELVCGKVMKIEQNLQNAVSGEVTKQLDTVVQKSLMSFEDRTQLGARVKRIEEFVHAVQEEKKNREAAQEALKTELDTVRASVLKIDKKMEGFTSEGVGATVQKEMNDQLEKSRKAMEKVEQLGKSFEEKQQKQNSQMKLQEDKLLAAAKDEAAKAASAAVSAGGAGNGGELLEQMRQSYDSQRRREDIDIAHKIMISGLKGGTSAAREEEVMKALQNTLTEAELPKAHQWEHPYEASGALGTVVFLTFRDIQVRKKGLPLIRAMGGKVSARVVNGPRTDRFRRMLIAAANDVGEMIFQPRRPAIEERKRIKIDFPNLCLSVDGVNVVVREGIDMLKWVEPKYSGKYWAKTLKYV